MSRFEYGELLLGRDLRTADRAALLVKSLPELK